MCIFLAYDLLQSIGNMLPNVPVIVHHILQEKGKALSWESLVRWRDNEQIFFLPDTLNFIRRIINFNYAATTPVDSYPPVELSSAVVSKPSIDQATAIFTSWVLTITRDQQRSIILRDFRKARLLKDGVH